MAKMRLIVHSGYPPEEYVNMTADEKNAHLLEKCVEAGYKPKIRDRGVMINNPEHPIDWAYRHTKKQKKKFKLRVDRGRPK